MQHEHFATRILIPHDRTKEELPVLRIFCKSIPHDRIRQIEQQIVDDARAGHNEAALRHLQPLRQAQRGQRDAAESLLRIVNRQCLPTEAALNLLSEVLQVHRQDLNILIMIGDSVEAVRDVDDLNSPPPEHGVFWTIVEELASYSQAGTDLDANEGLLGALGGAARMLARQRDEIAEKCYRQLTEINPKKSAYHYNLGLFFKTRGRFEEGMESNMVAIDLADQVDESYEWNLGICATGCRNGSVARDAWRRLGHKIELGRFGLPEGPYPQCKVKLAARPLAERTAETDDPGLEETIWIERLSPCHGIIRSVLYQDLGVDYGDVVLMDGAPITFHNYGGTRIDVFPHLATLFRRGYQFFDFAGTQDEPDRLSGSSADLAEDAVVYSHSESFQLLCATCWRDPDRDHLHHERAEKHVVTGRIAAPKHIDPADLLAQIDQAIAERSPCRLFAPDLCRMAGLEERARVEQRRFDILRKN